MKSTTKALIAVGVAATLSLGSTVANAAVLASSTFTINNFVISDASTGNALNLGSFSTIVATNNAGVAADLNGGALSANDGFNQSFLDPNTDLGQVCVGNCTSIPTENNFTVLTPPVTSGNFGHADQFLAGSSIDLGAGAGALAQVRSDVSLVGTGEGSADANVGLDATFIFSLMNPIQIGFDFNAVLDLIAHADPGTTFPGNAQASSGLEITLSELNTGNVVFDFSNFDSGLRTGCDLGHTINRNAPFNGTSSYNCTDTFSATTGILSNQNTYQLSIRQTVDSDALLIPEPGTIALLGAGLFGLGMARRRRNKQ